MLTCLSMFHDIICTVFSQNTPVGFFLGAVRKVIEYGLAMKTHSCPLAVKVGVALSSPGEQEETLPKNRDSLSVGPTN